MNLEGEELTTETTTTTTTVTTYKTCQRLTCHSTISNCSTIKIHTRNLIPIRSKYMSGLSVGNATVAV